LLDLKAKKKYPSPQDKASLQLKWNQLHARVKALESVQASYIYGAEGLHDRISSKFVPICGFRLMIPRT